MELTVIYRSFVTRLNNLPFQEIQTLTQHIYLVMRERYGDTWIVGMIPYGFTRPIYRPSLLPTIRSIGSGHPECKVRPRNPFHDPHYDGLIWSPKPRCFVGGKYLVTMAAGVGTGPELMEVVRRVFEVANAPVFFEELPMGADADETDMENLIYSIERNGVAIKGNIEQALEPQEISRNMQIRRTLDLYANLIEIKTYPGAIEKSRLKKNVDVVLVRQNLEGEFAMMEHENGAGIEHLKITSIYNTRRLAEFAFKYALEHSRKQVTVICTNTMQKSVDLFLDVIGDVASKYPEIPLVMEKAHVFASHMTELRFNGDVLLTGVVTGGIIMSLLFSMLNGTGLYCGQNFGERYVVFEPAARNKGFKMAGKNVVNPVVALKCGNCLLRHLGQHVTAERIENAIDLTINTDKILTKDLMGDATTSQMVENIERRIRETMPEGYRDAKPPPPPSLQNMP